MGYTLPQIAVILAKADRTMYKIGSVAYNDMFNELDESLDYNRDIIYIYKVAVEYADNFYVGTDKLDAVVERLGAKIAVYDFGQLTPIYSNATIVTQSVPVGAALDDLSDVTITNVQNNQTLRYSSSLGQWINVGPGAAVRNRQQFTATLNQTVFVTTFPFESGLLDVYLNGVKLSPPSYTTFGNYTITLADGSLVDDIVEVIAYDPATSFIDLSGYVPTSRTLTINGVTYDLSANRTWTIDALPSQAGNTGKYLTTDGVVASWGDINLSGYVPYIGATANVDLGGFSIKASMVQITGINSGGTGGVLNIKKGNTRVIGGDDAANNLSLWAETAAFGFNDWVSGNLRNAKFSLLSITNNATRTYTLPNLDGTLALLSDITPGLTSVGLSMPSAFAVSNSPLTSNGTIAVTGAGTASQYVRGDGQLANFPTNGGGGSSVNYYLNGSVTQGTFGGDTYYEMSKTPVLGAGTDFTRTNAQGNGYIASFITDAGDPSLLSIPGGNWNLEFYFNASSSGSTPQFYGEIYKVDASNNFTLIASASANPETISSGTTVDQYFTSIPVPQTSLLVTDRLAVRIYVIPSGRTITLHTENSNLCEVLTTFSTGLNALNGLTAQVQYFATGTSGTDFGISSATDTHTFNLPTASATNRGALNSADWTTFSGKVGGSGATGQVAYWNGTSSQTGSNNLFWDAANSRLGIGTNTPSASLHIVKSTVNDALLVVTPNNNSSLYPFFLGGATLTSDTYLRANASILEFNRVGNPSTIRTVGGGTNNLVLQSNDNLIFNSNGANERGRFTLLGNLHLGTFVSDSGQRLQVIGDAFIKGSGATSATTGLTVQDSAANNLLRLRNDGTILFGSLTAAISPYIVASNGTNNSPNIGNDSHLSFVCQNNANSNGSPVGFRFTASFQPQAGGTPSLIKTDGTFTQSANSAGFNIANLVYTINQTGTANGITRGLYVQPTLTSAADWRSIEWSNNSGWGLYGAGTANNYLAGSLGIGTTSPIYKLDVQGTVGTVAIRAASNTAGDILYYGTGSVTGSTDAFRTAINATGNVNLILANNNTATGGSALDISVPSASSGDPYLTFTTSGATNWSIGIDNSDSDKFKIGPVSNPSNSSTAIVAHTTGNISLNSATDAGFKLDVNGTARVSGDLTLGGSYRVLYFGAGSNTYIVGENNDGLYLSAKKIEYSDVTTKYGRFQRVGGVTSFLIGEDGAGRAAAASSILELFSSTQGFLPPRMTNAQRTAISSPAVGLLVYQTDSTEGTYEYISSGWRIINGGGGGGSVDELQVALLSQVYG
jgi:hypothetical protein